MASNSGPSSLQDKAGEIYRSRRRALFVTADRTLLRILPMQWSGVLVLSLLQSHAHTQAGTCTAGLNPWTTVLWSTVINGTPLALVWWRPGRWVTRVVIAASQALFYILLMCAAAGRFDTHSYLFVSLAFLAFYRDWRLLLGVGCVAIAAQYAYGPLVCATSPGGADLWSFLEFALWVILETCVLLLVCNRGTLLFRTNAREAAQLELARAQAYAQVLERTRQLEASNEQYRALLESTSAVPWELDDGTGACTYIGAQVEKQWGWTRESFQHSGFLFSRVYAEDRPAFAQALEEAVATHDVSVECRMHFASEKLAHVRSFIRHAPDKTTGRVVRGISIDITAQKRLESELNQAQKLESVGRLAAGVAHEINTPVQFISDNCYFLRDAVGEMRALVHAYRDACAAAAAGVLTPGEVLERMSAAERSADITFLTDNMPLAVERALEGLERVAGIVRSMKEFSHPDQDAPSTADLNAAIRSTLTIARNEYKYVADVETRFGEIPPVVCHLGEFNQAFLNILVNAAHAIGEVVAGTDRRGLIVVSTDREGKDVVISVKDTGGGIAEQIRDKIFDPFFTTKEVGKGTGQGLPIARAVIVDKHRGSLTFETESGVGTTFVIRMPLERAPSDPAAPDAEVLELAGAP